MYKRACHILFVFIAVHFLLPTDLFSQSFTEPSKLKQFGITVNFEDYTVKTEMLNQDKKIDINNDRTYMWYGSQKIMETKGGYDGKLLHGSYRAFYLNNQLKEQGEIKYGLRHKEWKYWYPDGKLREVITWKDGVKNGPYYLYNDYGQLMAKSNFKNDKLNGTFYTYGSTGNIIDKKKYKNGDEVPKKISSQNNQYQPPSPAVEAPQPEEKVKPAEPAPKKEKKKKKAKDSKSTDKEEKKKIVTS